MPMNGQPPGAAWEVGPLTRRVVLPPEAEIAVAVGQPVEPATPLAQVPVAAVPVALSSARSWVSGRRRWPST